METEARFVLDTNVVISALLLANSVPRKAFDLARQRGRLLISVATMTELNEVLRRPRFDKYLREEDRLEFVTTLVRESVIVEISETITECRDPKDNKFLELAVSGQAAGIVTGDSDLLSLDPFRGIRIVTPTTFVDMT